MYPNGHFGKRIVDLGRLEGGFATTFARMGLESLGVEVRESNFKNCMYVKERVKLPNLDFKRDNAWNIGTYGKFDIVFCAGLFYHMEEPRKFLREISKACTKMLFLDTHFAPEAPNSVEITNHCLSELTVHEGLLGRWYTEHDLDFEADKEKLDKMKWHSWENKKSFWLLRTALLQAIIENDFDIVSEAAFSTGGPPPGETNPNIFRDVSRSVFIGIRL